MNCQRKAGDELDEILSPFSLPGCNQEKGKKKEMAGEEEKKGKKKRERRQKEWEGKMRSRNGLRKLSSNHVNGGGDEDLSEQMVDVAVVAPFTPEEGSEMDSGSFRGALHPRKGVPRRAPLF